MRRLVAALAAGTTLVVGAVAAPTSATEAPGPTGASLVASFDVAPLPDVAPLGTPVAITGDRQADLRIRLLAESRGYRLRPLATAPLGRADGQPLHAAAAAAWAELDAAGRAAGVSMWVRSGYRDPDVQRSIFLGQLGNWSPQAIVRGEADDAIERALRRAAPPGYSKHQTGFAVDLAAPSGAFGASAAYRWLAADGFANARRHGFLPSYPPDTPGMGPDPEPWEFVWVGPWLAN